jgi:syntaxin 16
MVGGVFFFEESLLPPKTLSSLHLLRLCSPTTTTTTMMMMAGVKLPTRDLTSKYVRFRDEYVSSSANVFLSPSSSLHAGLLARGDGALSNDDAENGRSHALSPTTTLPPAWIDVYNQASADMRSIKDQIDTLRTLHHSRLQVCFNEETVKGVEREIDVLTQSVTSNLRKCENSIRDIALVGHLRSLTVHEKTTRINSMRMLASDLMVQSKAFRQAQKNFLRHLTDQTHHPQEDQFGLPDSVLVNLDQALSEDQQLQLDEISAQSSAREKEIIRVARSIHELSSLFSDLHTLVIDSGTMMDHIEYNIDQARVHVERGVVQLKSAETHSSRSLTCKCILLLVVIIVILLGILIYKKSK